MTENKNEIECPLCHGSGRIQAPEVATLELAVERILARPVHPPVKMSEPKPEVRRFLITQDDVKQMGRKGIRNVDQAVALIRRLTQEHSDYQVMDVTEKVGPDPEGAVIVTLLYRIPQVEASFDLFGIKFQEVVDEDNQEGGA